MYHNVLEMIGEFEYLILAATKRLGDDAYGASIRKEIESATGGGCSIGALYTTLDRLEAKGFVRTWMGEPTPERGGRSKRRVRITVLGVKAAADFFKAMSRVSEGVSWAKNQATTR
jgi:DNA-binding PadR family transcriptional regulator